MTREKARNLSPNPGRALSQAHWEDPEVRSVDGKDLTGGIDEVDVLCICCLEWMISIINLYFALAQRGSYSLMHLVNRVIE